MWLQKEIDPGAEKTEKLPALVVPPVFGVLPFTGSLNPLTRSNTAHRISMTIPTPATEGVRKIFHFDGEREMAVALEALLHPDLYNLEVQLPGISYQVPGKKKQTHFFDIRLTFRDGYRRAVYVKNGSTLARREAQDEIDAIFRAVPEEFADDLIVVNGDYYTRPYACRAQHDSLQGPDTIRSLGHYPSSCKCGSTPQGRG